MYQVAILASQQLMVDGFCFRLTQGPGTVEFQIAGVANVYSDWEPLLASKPMDVALMDVAVPTSPKDRTPYPLLQVLPRLIAHYDAQTTFLVIAEEAEPALVQGVMQAGANGYILRDDNALQVELKNVLASVVAGRGVYLSPRAKESLIQHPPIAYALSPRQTEALHLCAKNPTTPTKQLAAHMHLGYSTLRSLLSQVYLRLGVTGRNAAVLRAQQLGLLPPD